MTAEHQADPAVAGLVEEGTPVHSRILLLEQQLQAAEAARDEAQREAEHYRAQFNEAMANWQEAQRSAAALRAALEEICESAGPAGWRHDFALYVIATAVIERAKLALAAGTETP